MSNKLKTLPDIIHDQDKEISYGLCVRKKGNKVQILYKAVSFSLSKKWLKKGGLYILHSVKGETLLSAQRKMLDYISAQITDKI